MTDYVRIKDPSSGAEYTYTRAQLAVTGLTEADIIDRPALGPDGLPAPAKPSLPKGTPLPGSAQERRRSRKTASPKTTEAISPGKDAGQTSAADKEN